MHAVWCQVRRKSEPWLRTKARLKQRLEREIPTKLNILAGEGLPLLQNGGCMDEARSISIGELRTTATSLKTPYSLVPECCSEHW